MCRESRLPLIIGRGDQGQGSLDLHQDDMLDGAGGPTVPIESERLLKNEPFFVDGGRPFEAISLAGNRVNHVDLDDWSLLHIGDGSR